MHPFWNPIICIYIIHFLHRLKHGCSQENVVNLKCMWVLYELVYVHELWETVCVSCTAPLHWSQISERRPSAGLLPHAAELPLHPTNQHNKSQLQVCFFQHDLLFASWTESSAGFSGCNFNMKQRDRLVGSQAFGVIKVNVILATVIELHSCYRFSTWAPPPWKGERVTGEGRGEREREREREREWVSSGRGMQEGK